MKELSVQLSPFLIKKIKKCEIPNCFHRRGEVVKKLSVPLSSNLWDFSQEEVAGGTRVGREAFTLNMATIVAR
jgi:hypothetical protein